MQNNLLVVGIARIIGALVGGGLKAFTIEIIPLLSSVCRQIMVGVFGAVLLVLNFALWRKNESSASPVLTRHREEASRTSSGPSSPAQPSRTQKFRWQNPASCSQMMAL